MRKIILMAESGSDINAELAAEYGIYVVPMHVQFGNETLDDGSFPVSKIIDYYKENKKLPKTSGSVPKDFLTAFDTLHTQRPQDHILYIAYSAITTCSFQSAVIAAEDRDYITMLDTRQVSAGHGLIVITLAKYLKQHPEATLHEVHSKAEELIERVRMCFIPENLEYLRAGGRVSNVAFLGSVILNIHPCIEILEGKLTATKKYRGKMSNVVNKLIKEYSETYDLDKEELWLVYTIGFTDELKQIAEKTAKECGFKSVFWVMCQGVITTHGGPAAFGLAGFTK
ncbi:MAG: DegV family EDD domain-containing protein [Erysipelotrichaceae bacterium]|nr:DegV family EDD domain-containing protein [Erysipelotrichaceae bacterium]